MCVRPTTKSQTPKPRQKGGTCTEVTANLSQPTVKSCDWLLGTHRRRQTREKLHQSSEVGKRMTRQVEVSSAFPPFYRVLESPEKRLRHSQVPWQVLLFFKTRSYCVVPAGPELALHISWLGTQDLSASSCRVLGSKGYVTVTTLLSLPEPCQHLRVTETLHFICITTKLKINDQ